MGKNIRGLIERVWNDQQFILRQCGFYSDPVDIKRGCTQGDVDSPVIFNIIIDAVIQSWKPSELYNNSSALFYADDGLVENIDPYKLQKI